MVDKPLVPMNATVATVAVFLCSETGARLRLKGADADEGGCRVCERREHTRHPTEWGRGTK